MAVGHSLLPVRPGRAVPSALPRAVPSAAIPPKSPPRPSFNNFSDTSPHDPVPSTSRLSPAQQSPPRSDLDASRFEWADLLAADPGGDLLNEESDSWLLDQSAFTIAAKTPAKIKTARKRSPTPLHELYRLDELSDEEPAAADPVAAVRVAAAEVATAHSPRTTRIPPSPPKGAQANPAASAAGLLAPPSPSSHPLPTIAEESASTSASFQEPEAAAADPTTSPANELPLSPPRARSKSATPSLETIAPAQDHAPRRHRPSLAPLPNGTNEIVETIAPRSRSRSMSPAVVLAISPAKDQLAAPATGETVVTLASSDGGIAQSVERAESSFPASGPSADDQAAVPTLPPLTVEAGPMGAGPAAQEEVTKAPPAARPSVAPGKRRVPRASLAVTSRMTATAPTRPAHLLPANHPAHPRPSLLPPSSSSSAAPISTASNPTAKAKSTAKAKGVPEPDEEARRRVREAKEAREKSAKERKDKMERHAEALREEKRREKDAAEAVAVTAAAAQRKAAAVVPAGSVQRIGGHEAHVERGNEEDTRPAGSLSAQAPSDSLWAISSQRPLENENATGSAAEPDAPTVPTAATVPTPPTAPTIPTRSAAPTGTLIPSHRTLPFVVVEAVDDSQHQSMVVHAFDANMTLPDMGAPLDFGSASAKQAQLASGAPGPSATTSTPARHLKRKADSGTALQPGLVDKAASAAGPPKRARRPSIAKEQLKPQSAALKEAPVLEAKQNVVERPVTKSVASPTATSATALAAERKRRASRFAVDHDRVEPVSGSRSWRDESTTSGTGRARVVRVTLQVPTAPPAHAPLALAESVEPASLSRGADKSRRRASRLTSPSADLAAPRPASSPAPAPVPGALDPPHHLLKHSRPVPIVSAPAPVTVELPPRPPVKPALVIGGITLPASFTFAEPEEEDEAERAKRLQEKERREQLAEAVLAEKKRVRESASAWAVRPDELTKRRRIVQPSSQHGSDAGSSHVAPAAVAAAATVGPCGVPKPSAQVAPPVEPASISTSTRPPAAVSITDTPDELVALTKEALERNSRKAGPRPDLQRRVSRFLEEISEAEKPLEDVLLSGARDYPSGVPELAAPSVAATAAVVSAGASGSAVGPDAAERAKPPVTTALLKDAVLAVNDTVQPVLGQGTTSAKSMRNAPIAAERAQPKKLPATSSTVLKPASKRPAEPVKTISDSQPAKKVRRDQPALATASAARIRPTGQENGAVRQRAEGGVAAEIEKQLQARLAWSERQKKREEEAKAFRQRQRDEEANRERAKLAQLRSSLQQARRPAPPLKAAARPVSRT